jgi:hypothetical protein
MNRAERISYCISTPLSLRSGGLNLASVFQHAVLSFDGFDLVDLAKDPVHMLQTDAFRFRPEQHHDNQAQKVNAHKDVIGIVSYAAEHHGPGLVDPQGRRLLAHLRDIDTGVT